MTFNQKLLDIQRSRRMWPIIRKIPVNTDRSEMTDMTDLTGKDIFKGHYKYAPYK